MATSDNVRPQHDANQSPPGMPQIGGDVASHVLVIDRQVSHSAFRL